MRQLRKSLTGWPNRWGCLKGSIKWRLVALITFLIAGAPFIAVSPASRLSALMAIPENETALSMIVQPDRINLKGESYDLTVFSNDQVTLDVYLANRGELDVEDIKGVLTLPEGLGFDPTHAPAQFTVSRIAGREIVVGSFAFSTSEVSPGFYTLALAVQDQEGRHSFTRSIVVKVVERDLEAFSSRLFVYTTTRVFYGRLPQPSGFCTLRLFRDLCLQR